MITKFACWANENTSPTDNAKVDVRRISITQTKKKLMTSESVRRVTQFSFPSIARRMIYCPLNRWWWASDDPSKPEKNLHKMSAKNKNDCGIHRRLRCLDFRDWDKERQKLLYLGVESCDVDKCQRRSVNGWDSPL